MNEEPMHKQSMPPLDICTRLAYEGTYLAHERTLMGWVRTAISLISFGFTIAKVFEYLCEKAGDAFRPSGCRHHHDRDRTGGSGVGDYATSACFKGIARALLGPASVASRSNGSVLRVAGHPRLVQRRSEDEVRISSNNPTSKDHH